MIISNTATSIDCWGKTAESNETGEVFDPHICECGFAHAAIDFGDADYLDWETGAGDVCDLDGDGEDEEDLPYDLDPPNARNQGTGPAPDAGAYEVPD